MLNEAIICLALTVYHESRGEPLIGRMAVAQVVLNRVDSPDFPNNVCDVIKEPGQFEWYEKGLQSQLVDAMEWTKALELSKTMIKRKIPKINDFLFFHALPDSHGHENTFIIGNHIFW